MEICNSLSPPYLQKAWTRLKWTMSSFCRFFPWLLFVCSKIHQFCIHSSSMSYMPGFWNYFRIFFSLLQDRSLHLCLQQEFTSLLEFSSSFLLPPEKKESSPETRCVGFIYSSWIFFLLLLLASSAWKMILWVSSEGINFLVFCELFKWIGWCAAGRDALGLGTGTWNCHSSRVHEG